MKISPVEIELFYADGWTGQTWRNHYSLFANWQSLTLHKTWISNLSNFYISNCVFEWERAALALYAFHFAVVQTYQKVYSQNTDLLSFHNLYW